VTAPARALIDELRGPAYVELLAPLWSYLAVAEAPSPGDVVFAFGCGNLCVPQRAANLQLDGWAPRVLVSGGSGRRAGELFGRSEAAVFARHLRWLGVPEAAIVSEDRAANTGENVTLGMRALDRAGVRVERALLVAKPFGMRRCAATFRLRYPRVRTVCCPPPGPMLEFVEGTRRAFAARLLAELDRLDRYPRLGYIAGEPSPPPRPVTEAAAEVRRLLAAPRGAASRGARSPPGAAGGLHGAPDGGGGGRFSGAARRCGRPGRRRGWRAAAGWRARAGGCAARSGRPRRGGRR
jgi:hypothetical protein